MIERDRESIHTMVVEVVRSTIEELAGECFSLNYIENEKRMKEGFINERNWIELNTAVWLKGVCDDENEEAKV